MPTKIDFPPFVPHPWLQHAHVMTIVGSLARGGARAFARGAEERIVEVDASTRIMARCHWQPDGAREAAVVLVHGLIGDSDSTYMVGTARKAFEAGLDAVRMNVRSCGDTEDLTQSTYHGGLTADVRALATQLAEEDGFRRVYLAGFSLGGNIVMKWASELGADAPPWLAGVVGVSPCIDFALAAARLNQGFQNRLYQRRFVAGLKRILRRRNALAPDDFPLDSLDRARTLREFDDRFTAPLAGFRDADDYYEQASAVHSIERITVPSLIVAARDDPLIPFETFERPAVEGNPHVRVLGPDCGGHTAFVARSPAANGGWRDADRYWAENRVVQFCCERARG